MHSLVLSSLVFACVFVSVLLGMWVRSRVPNEHLVGTSEASIKLGTGIIATLVGLVLGLLVASSKGSFDTKQMELNHFCTKVTLLDHLLERYGPETKPVRHELREFIEAKLVTLWPIEAAKLRIPSNDRIDADHILQHAIDAFITLSPQPDQKQLHDRIANTALALAEMRWLMTTQRDESAIPTPFLIVFLFWVSILFFSFGLFAPRNATVVASMFVCALSIAGAIFLVLEMDRPLGGIIKLSSRPVQQVLNEMGRD